MKKIFFAFIIIVIGGSVELYLNLQNKKLKVINIPNFTYVRELSIEGEPKEKVAHLYENQDAYWVRYITADEKIKDIVLYKKNLKKDKYVSVRVIDTDSCVLLK